MIEAFESLSLAATTAIVAVTSLLLLLAIASLLRCRWLWVAAVVVPLAVAYVAYWAPVWFGGRDPSAYSAWESLFMVAWGGVGMLACLLLAIFLRQRRARSNPAR
ncbi:hypothetical protein LYSHEL_19610 [Lysobacter helvus]|uniref:Uncharacterized protein n=2 Tax=Lysobacteraceae TaxID=32033 RepID=A0ABN6FZD9_9GAMM|nr:MULTISPECIES: hypothetical protein [Lysobacter]BCT92938.1 hypothetical protein LYSCAS_19620 [Lysobacter caseinilyticus]BCT96090.1 hypothetical protein LYSHEL_19610 [Lysobacter helvus]